MLETVRLSGASDPDGDPTLIRIDAVTQDEPVSGTGIGDPTLPDAHFTAAAASSNQVKLHGEHNPLDDGRVYHVAFTVNDAQGASCVGDSTLAVPRDPTQPAVDSAHQASAPSPAPRP